MQPNQKPQAGLKKKEDGAFDLEQHFILRMPSRQAVSLHHDVQSGAMNLKDRLSIELAPDARRGKVTYGGEIFNAKLVDLPCIIETLKTTDRKTFYKASDIAQMLICTNEDDESPDEVDSPSKKKDRDKRYQWNHGVCPPLKNVRKRRFRKTLQKKYQEQPDIEKEVKNLFRMDNEAIDVKWEVVYEEEKSKDAEAAESRTVKQEGVDSKMNRFEIAEHEIFGEVSSSDDDDDGDINVMDNVDDGTNMSSRVDAKESITSIDYSASESYGSVDPDITLLHNQRVELERRLDELHQKRMALEMEISIIDNSSLKEKLEWDLSGVIDEEQQKQQEFEILCSMLNQ